ncbi:GroES-like protein [Neurospora crassa]|nr:GroES-like protein [Neurospora crassa]
MKEAIVADGPKVQIIDSPIPSPNDDQVLIRVIVSGCNPKDWKLPGMMPDKPPLNQGDDIAGIVEKVGSRVWEFKPGDRVAAFHEMLTPHGSWAEYAVAWQHTTFHIPKETSFEEAAALPLAAMTAAVGLFSRLGLPEPWVKAVSDEERENTPLVIYGASSAVGYYALQLAKRSNIHPLICIAGRAGGERIAPLLDQDKGDVLIDYREGEQAVVEGIKKALNGRPLLHALDAVSEKGTPEHLAQVLSQPVKKGDKEVRAKATFVLFGKMGVPDFVDQSTTLVGSVHQDEKDFGYVWYRYMARGLQEGWFKAQKTEVIPGGLAGVQEGLERLKDGKASAVKYVYRIQETEGVERSEE